MPEKILKKGTLINVKNCSDDDLLRNYGGVFEKNGEGKIVTKLDGVVKVENGTPYFLDMKKGHWEPIEIENDTKKGIEEEEVEEYDEDEDEEIEEGYQISRSNFYKTNPVSNYGSSINDGQTFYYFPKPKKKKDGNGVEDTRDKFQYGNNGQTSPNVNPSNPMSNSMLGDKFDEFVNAVNESKALSIKDGCVKGASTFKRKYLDKIDNCKLLFYAESQDKKDEHWNISFFSDDKYIKTQIQHLGQTLDLTPMNLNKSNDRIRLLNQIELVMDKLQEDCIINRQARNPLRKIKPLSIPACIRYVSYAALGDVLQECADMKYSDIGTPAARKTYQKVDKLIKALSLEGSYEEHKKHGGKKKEAFLEALNIWKNRYEQMRSKLNNNELEEYVVNNERPGINLDTNNRNRGRNENFGLFTTI